MKWRLLVPVVLAACSLGAQAVVTQLFSPSEMTTSFVNDFESGALNLGPVNIADSSIVLASGFAHGVTPSQSHGASRTPSTSTKTILTGSFTAAGTYFGGDDPGASSGYDVTLMAFSGGALLGSVTVAANMNHYADQFIGLSSTVPFDDVWLTYTYKSGGSMNYIDDFRVGSPVPEPAAYALMLAGLCSLCLFARRRNG